MDLKIKDVADLLNVSETTIRRWLADGKIPAYKINHQYRFSRFEIEDWVMGQKLGVPTGNVPFNGANKTTINLDDNVEEQINHVGRKQFSLYRAIHQGGVYHDIPGDTKEQVIRATMKRVAAGLNLDADVITELLLDRENLQPTALNNGIGVPHTRDCLLNPGKNIINIVFPMKPIEYGALDGKPVHTLIFLFACEDKRHLHLLAKIAHLSSKKETLSFLQAKPTKNQLLEYIKNWEGSISKPEA